MVYAVDTLILDIPIDKRSGAAAPREIRNSAAAPSETRNSAAARAKYEIARLRARNKRCEIGDGWVRGDIPGPKPKSRALNPPVTLYQIPA